MVSHVYFKAFKILIIKVYCDFAKILEQESAFSLNSKKRGQKLARLSNSVHIQLSIVP